MDRLILHLPMKMEPIEDSETSAFKTQTPGKYPKENILHFRICYYMICATSAKIKWTMGPFFLI
jgi:hypothetical protein